MKLGYFTPTDNPPQYGDRRREPRRFFDEVVEEAVSAEERSTKEVMSAARKICSPREPVETRSGPDPIWRNWWRVRTESLF